MDSFLTNCEAHAELGLQHSNLAEFFPCLNQQEFLGSGSYGFGLASNVVNLFNSVEDINASDNVNFGFLPYGENAKAIPIDPQKLSLPHKCGSVNLVSCLPRTLRRSMHPSRMMRTQPLHNQRAGCAFMVQPGQYPALIRRLIDCDMVRLQRNEPLAINGLFGIPKADGSQRLIVDCRRANAIFADPAPVKLPTPDTLTRLVVRRDLGNYLFVAKADLSDFYHCLRLPKTFWPFFGLPAVSPAAVGATDRFPDAERIWPVITTLPMGWHTSVVLAQAFHLRFIALHVPLLRQRDMIVEGNGWLVDRLRWSAYIDDLSIFGADSHAVNAALEQYCDRAAAFGLAVKASKRQRATSTGAEVTGFTVDGRRFTVGVAPFKLAALARTTLALARTHSVYAHDLERVMGRWTWACLARRPAFAVFGAVYAWLTVFAGQRAPLWPSVRLELALICALSPLLHTNIGLTWFTQAVAVDASSTGHGTVVLEMQQEAQTQLASKAGIVTHRHVKQSDRVDSALDRTFTQHKSVDASLSAVETSRITSARWATVISKPWKRAEHINLLESTALRCAIRWCHVRGASQCRLLVFCDSAVVVACTSKGRSSSLALLSNCRRNAALLLSSCLHLHIRWIPSLINPADGPSRAH